MARKELQKRGQRAPEAQGKGILSGIRDWGLGNLRTYRLYLIPHLLYLISYLLSFTLTFIPIRLAQGLRLEPLT